MTDDEKVRLFARAIVEMVPKPGEAERSAMKAWVAQRIVAYAVADQIGPPALEMLRRQDDLRLNLLQLFGPYMPRSTWFDLFLACTDEDFTRMHELLGDELRDYAD
jgi:hypothetical protein